MTGRTRLIAAAAAAIALAALGAAFVIGDWRDDSGSGGTAASARVSFLMTFSPLKPVQDDGARHLR